MDRVSAAVSLEPREGALAIRARRPQVPGLAIDDLVAARPERSESLRTVSRTLSVRGGLSAVRGSGLSAACSRELAFDPVGCESCRPRARRPDLMRGIAVAAGHTGCSNPSSALSCCRSARHPEALGWRRSAMYPRQPEHESGTGFLCKAQLTDPAWECACSHSFFLPLSLQAAWTPAPRARGRTVRGAAAVHRAEVASAGLRAARAKPVPTVRAPVRPERSRAARAV
jgi:hypothetical protein